MIHFIIYVLILSIMMHCIFHYFLSLYQSAMNIYMNHNYEYSIESLQLENDLLRNNIIRLENKLKEKN